MAQSSENLYKTTGIRVKKDACVVIVKTEWNEAVINAMLTGCKQVLDKFKIRYKVVTVPGAVEIPFAISSYYRNHVKGKEAADAFIAMGCVIKGDTPHFDYVCDSVTQGITTLNTSLTVPVIYGVLTVLTEQQAWDRLGGAHGHKGEEAAMAAIKMISLNESFSVKKEKK